jgi:hypothetical protein
MSAFMAKKIMSLLATMVVIGGGATLFAQGGAKPGEGTLMVQDKNYPLRRALAPTLAPVDPRSLDRGDPKCAHLARARKSEAQRGYRDKSWPARSNIAALPWAY